MHAIPTQVLAPDPTRFDMTGRRLTTSLHTVDECISAGLAKRLVGYASQAMAASGFDAITQTWAVSVYL